MTISDQIRDAAIDVTVTALPMPCLCALLDHSYKWDWLAASFHSTQFRTFALLVAEAIDQS